MTSRLFLRAILYVSENRRGGGGSVAAVNSPPVSSDWGKTGRLARQNAPAGFLWLASAAQLRNELQRHRVGLSDGRAVPGPARLGWVSWASRWVRAAAVHRNKEGRSSKLRPSYVRPRRGLGGMGLAGRCLTFPQFAAVGPVLRPYGSGPWHQNKSPATSAPGGWRGTARATYGPRELMGV